MLGDEEEEDGEDMVEEDEEEGENWVERKQKNISISTSCSCFVSTHREPHRGVIVLVVLVASTIACKGRRKTPSDYTTTVGITIIQKLGTYFTQNGIELHKVRPSIQMDLS